MKFVYFFFPQIIKFDTLHSDSYTTSLTVDGQEYEIEIIDTAGQEEYRFNLEGTCREGDGFILTLVSLLSSFDLEA